MYQCLIEKSDTEQELLQIGDTLFMFKNIIADMSTGTISYLK